MDLRKAISISLISPRTCHERVAGDIEVNENMENSWFVFRRSTGRTLYTHTSQWSGDIAFANDTYGGGCPDRICARTCVSTRGEVHVIARREGRARKPSSNSKTGDSVSAKRSILWTGVIPRHKFFLNSNRNSKSRVASHRTAQYQLIRRYQHSNRSVLIRATKSVSRRRC